MGRGIEHERFAESDYTRFSERLALSLTALRELLDRPGFGESATSLGQGASFQPAPSGVRTMSVE